MIKINLVPADILAKAVQKQQNIQIAMVGSAVGVFLLGVSALHYFKAVRLKKELVVHKAELARLEEVVKKVKEAEAKAAALRTRLKAIDDLSKERPRYPYLMSDFTRSVPVGVWVKGMVTSLLPNKTIRLAIQADANTSEDIATWFKNMEVDGKFSAMEMGPLAVGNDKSLAFSVTAVYTPKF